MHFLTLASVALTAVAGASAISIPHNHVRHVKRIEKEKPDTYYEGYLEVSIPCKICVSHILSLLPLALPDLPSPVPSHRLR